MIQFTNVSMVYPRGNKALQNIDLNIDKGEMVYISGHSGAGKSTLLRLINLVDRHTRGQIIVKGQNLERIRNKRVAKFRRNIGFIFQDHKLLNDRTIFDNVALPLVIAGNTHQDIKRRVQASLDKVGLLSKINNYPMELSSGECQRIGFARAVVHRPTILLADEPTGNLDPALSWEMMKLFEQFNQVGVTVMIASHELDMIKHMHKRIIVLNKGRTVDI
jgi:cell division transport system ATP-binding protein|tara:strand:- start:384 stop:1040 length:657 start_codon:yes stop_codon:yes gene_type:complete